MREIKYKAWDKKSKKMRAIDSISFHGLGVFDTPDQDIKLINLWGRDIIEDKHIIVQRNPNEVELLSYTGLKDKNCKEIYEGDVVKSSTQNNVIKFQHGSFMVLGLDEDEYERTYSRLYHFLIDATIPNIEGSRFDGVITTLEVIGNIYENPHLLKG